MQRSCLKCSHVNAAANDSDTEACPQCGAIYSKVEMASATRRPARPMKQGAPTWVYLLLLVVLAVTVPLTIYEQVWGTAAKHRKSEGALRAAQADQRVQEQAAIAKAKRGAMDQAVSQGRVVVGMSAAQVQTSWGQPTSVNRTVTGRGTNEQWVYRRSDVKTNYVYLDDGVVRSFQVSE